LDHHRKGGISESVDSSKSSCQKQRHPLVILVVPIVVSPGVIRVIQLAVEVELVTSSWSGALADLLPIKHPIVDVTELLLC
jgi:hypothetical protein